MVRERGAKKKNLEEIKDKMREMRNKRLARVARSCKGTPTSTTSSLAHKSASSLAPSGHLASLQRNNIELALALQAQKQNMRQANAVILQLKIQQQNLLLRLVQLQKKLQQQQQQAERALATSSPLAQEWEPPGRAAVRSPRRERLGEVKCDVSPVCADVTTSTEVHAPRPPAAVTRQQPVVSRRKSRRRSDRVRSIGEVSLGVPLTKEEPREAEERLSAQESGLPAGTRDRRRPRAEAEAPPRKPSVRAPLKKPWENPERRGRPKTRERRARPPPAQQPDASLGRNDTFDFDCGEAVHLTPFRAKPDHPEEPAPEPGSPDDGVDLPAKKARRGRLSPETAKAVAARRGRPSNTKSGPSKSEHERWQSDAKAKLTVEANRSHGPHLLTCRQEPLRQDLGDALPRVRSVAEVDATSIKEVLGHFGPQSGSTPKRKKHGPVGMPGRDVTNRSPAACHQRFSCPASDLLGSSTPPVFRTRRRAPVDYKEPSLNGKLRRGDKHTDLRFLRPGSPIFKNKLVVRRSQTSKTERYNEPLVR